ARHPGEPGSRGRADPRPGAAGDLAGPPAVGRPGRRAHRGRRRRHALSTCRWATDRGPPTRRQPRPRRPGRPRRAMPRVYDACADRHRGPPMCRGAGGGFAPDDARDDWELYMTVDLAVVGLGYVGLPLVYEAVHAGMSVRGYDVSERVVEGLNSGVSHIDDLSDAQVAELVERGFRATTDSSVLGEAETIVI